MHVKRRPVDFGIHDSSQNQRAGLAIHAKCQAATFSLPVITTPPVYIPSHTVNMAGCQNFPLLFRYPRPTNTPHINQNCTCVDLFLTHWLNTFKLAYKIPSASSTLTYIHTHIQLQIYSLSCLHFFYCLVKFEICKHLACSNTHGVDHTLLKEVSLE